MTSFDDRENAFESKFAHDAEMAFKANARRNKLVGLWAADLMGRVGDVAEQYAKDVIKADFEEAGDEDVIRKLVSDLGELSSEAEIREKLNVFLVEAKGQLMNEL